VTLRRKNIMPPTIRLAAAAILAAFIAGCQSAPKSATPAPEPQLPPPKTAEVSPKDRAKLHAELAAGYYERGQMDIALDELGDATKLDPENANVFNIYGLVYAVMGENAKAEQNFQRALQLSPQDSEIRHNWGWYLCTHGRAQESIAQFDQAVRNPLYKTPEIALVNAGRCSASLGDTAAAEQYFKRALAVSPGNPNAAYGLSLIAYRASRYDEARGWLRPAVLQANPAPEALYLGVCLERKLGDRQAEMSFTSQLKNRYPDSAETKALPSGVCE
jgi:type IV pilus assembly protein PilF